MGIQLGGVNRGDNPSKQKSSVLLNVTEGLGLGGILLKDLSNRNMT